MSKNQVLPAWLGVPACAAMLVGCASAPPQELMDARAAYQEARVGPAKEWNPADLHAAEQSLQRAESTFKEDGASDRARDEAYVALRKAQIADVQARIAKQRTRLEELRAQNESSRTEQIQELRAATAQQQTKLERVEQARLQAEQRAKELSSRLSEVAEVKQDQRGTVLTLSGSVLFASGESDLLPTARDRLSQVARALAEKAKEGKIIVEGHTDTVGSEEFNLELSARRAESVKDFLVENGVAEGRIETKGLGFSQPVAPNKTAAGRANNRRVEIVLEPRGGASGRGGA